MSLSIKRVLLWFLFKDQPAADTAALEVEIDCRNFKSKSLTPEEVIIAGDDSH